MVGHASNIETNSRMLIGRKARSHFDMGKIMEKVPYASLLMLEKSQKNKWKIVSPNVYPITHNKNLRFDWKDVAGVNDENESDCDNESPEISTDIN